MASRDYIKHVVAASEPVDSTLGDEYYAPDSNKLFKRLAVDGARVAWVEQQPPIGFQASGVVTATAPKFVNFPGAVLAFNSDTGVLDVVASGTPGGANGQIQFNTNGTFGASANFIFSGTNVVTLTGFLNSNGLRRTGGVNSTGWTTTSPGFDSAANTFTDLASSGTQALKVAVSFNSPTFAATNAITATELANVYMTAPIAGGNVTATNTYALYVAGNQRTTGTLLTAFFNRLAASTTTPSWTTSSPIFRSSAGIVTDTTGTGTIAIRAGNSFLSTTLASTNAVAITDPANVYIEAPVAGTNTTFTNNWALYVAGNQRIVSALQVDGSITTTTTDIGRVSNPGSAAFSGGTDHLRLLGTAGSAFSEPAIKFGEVGTNIGCVIAGKNTANGSMAIIFANRDTSSTTSTLLERMRLENAGNLLIGRITSDGYRLALLGNTQLTSSLQISWTGVAASTVGLTSAGALAFGLDVSSGSTSRMQLNSAGNLIVGGTTPTNSARTTIIGNATISTTAFLDSTTSTLSLATSSNGVRNTAALFLRAFDADGTSVAGSISVVPTASFRGNLTSTYMADTSGGAYIINQFRPTPGDTIQRLSISNTGVVTIGGPINMPVGLLGSVLGDRLDYINLRGTNSNANLLDVFMFRDAAGADWTTAGTRFQQRIDATFMGWMQFNGSGNTSGIAWGTGASTTSAQSIAERMRLDSAGSLRVVSAIASTTTTTGSVIVTGGVGVSGQLTAGTVQTTVLTTGAAATTGTVTGTWTLTASSTWQATFADLAEYYPSDVEYESGTVVIFGGASELTISTQANDRKIAGVVSTDPAYIMNAGCEGPRVCMALQGRVPVNVIGTVERGDMLVSSATPGYAMVNNNPNPGCVIGKAIESKTTDEPGQILVSVNI